MGEKVFYEGLEPHGGGEDGERCMKECVLVSSRAYKTRGTELAGRRRLWAMIYGASENA